jgi:hypothetical protein
MAASGLKFGCRHDLLGAQAMTIRMRLCPSDWTAIRPQASAR